MILSACSERRGSGRREESSDAPLQTALEQADELYWSGDFDSARVVYGEALEGARLAADTAAESRALTWLGLAAWRLGEYDEARRQSERALELKLAAGIDEELWRCYNALGLVAWNESRLSEAVSHYQEAAEAARASGAERGLATVAANLALVNQDLGRFTEARRGFEVAAEVGRSLGDPRIEGNAHNNLAALEILIGDPASAIEHLQTARVLYHSIDYVTGLQNALGQLSGAYMDLGEPGRALAYLDSALALSRGQGLRQDEASNLELLASLHRDLGDTRRALAIYEDARAIDAELGLDYETGADLRSEARIHLGFGDLALSERKAHEALRIHRGMGAQLEELFDLLLLAEIRAETTGRGEAGTYLEEARELAVGLHARSARVALALSEARIAERRDDPGGVLRTLDAARGDLADARYDARAEAHALTARAHTRLGSLAEAIKEGRSAVADIERARQALRSGYLRTTLLAQKNRLYGDLVGVLLSAGREEEAFQVADAARGRALVEHISVAKAEGGPASRLVGEYAKGDRLLLRINELLARLDELEEYPTDERDPQEESFLLNELQRTRLEYETLMVRAAETDPAGAIVLGTRSASVLDIEKALGPDEALLEYLVAEDRLYLFVVRRDGVASFTRQLPASALAARVRVARELSARPGSGWQEAGPILASLHRDLVAPAIEAGLLRGVDRLVIVPHRNLAYLPFAALRDEARGRYLVEDYALLGIPNAAALPVLRARQAMRGESGVGVSRGFAPYPDELPGTRAELEAFESAVAGARGRRGRRASESAVRQALTDRGIIHVASHAVLNADAPMFSRIELAPGGGGPENDGRLEVHELLGLAVRSRLVFLSGCETGIGSAGPGRYDAGEDYMMLAQAFLYAGADNVVATLWRVEDRSASDFATAFYQELSSSDPEVALARAQRRLLADPAHSAPFHWASYRITGSGGRRTGSATSAHPSVPPQ